MSALYLWSIIFKKTTIPPTAGSMWKTCPEKSTSLQIPFRKISYCTIDKLVPYTVLKEGGR
jgi:hypothetical protein